MALLKNVQDKIVDRITTGYGSGDKVQDKAFKEDIQNILSEEMAPIVVEIAKKAVQVVPVAQMIPQAAPARKGGNGYNLFGREYRAKMVVDLGSEEAAKAKFKELGGITGPTIKTEWHALTKPQKDEYNARAKAAREAMVPQAVMAPAPVAVALKPKRATSDWQRFQKAWNHVQKESGVTFADVGERSKACSAAYQPVKGTPALQAYLQAHMPIA